MTWTRLHDAVVHHNTALIIMLSQHFPIQASMVDDNGSTPLHLICWGNPELGALGALIKARSQAVLEKDVYGNTPLHIAASHPSTTEEVMACLLQACPDAASVKNKEGLMPLHMACRHAPQNEPVIALLVEVYPSALRTRTKMGQLVSPRKKKVAPADPNNQHFVTDLAGKSRLSPSLALENILSHQIRDGSYPLHMAIEKGTTRSILNLMLQEDIDILEFQNKRGETPLHIALAKNESDEVIELLLKTPNVLSLLKTKDKTFGNLPIHTGATYGCKKDTMEYLLWQYPLSIFAKNNSGHTPLDLAQESGRCSCDVIEFLNSIDFETFESKVFRNLRDPKRQATNQLLTIPE